MPLTDNDTAATYKVLVLGDATVGKTALLRCLNGQNFIGKTRPTVAVDFIRKKFEVDGALIQLNIWDTAGQERFMSMTRQSYRNVKCVINTSCDYESVPIVMIGNKLDLSESRTVTISEAKKFTKKEMVFDFFETSAKSSENVYTAFHKLAYHVTEICNPKLMKSYHPKMIRPPEILEKTIKTRSPSLSKRKSAKCVIDLAGDRVIYIPEKTLPVGKHRHSFRKGNYKFSVRKKKKNQKFQCQCCAIS
ncbi:hypothetical protein FSP39_007700 [Pinctada imbricata]|uniref:Uncharacterized protein n=1 Tax=Pinctada imbricata TaxID=66713 RepID=A0AA88XZP3_PINIB|nr:hypothetical protein FSP39_007700 [Pinctada imbricata]